MQKCRHVLECGTISRPITTIYNQDFCKRNWNPDAKILKMFNSGRRFTHSSEVKEILKPFESGSKQDPLNFRRVKNLPGIPDTFKALCNGNDSLFNT